MAPMGNINMADPIGRPLPKMIEYFIERARGGTGLLITGLIPVSFGIDPTVSEDNDTTYFPRIDGSSRTRLAGFRDLAAGVHAFDCRLFIQLTAGLGRVGSPEAMLKGKILKSASWNRNFYVPQIPHIPLSDRQIKKMVKSFGQAAINAKVSGFDGVHLHGHEGYMMDQLTSLPWNRRKLGRYRNRFQFALDVVNEIKSMCGKDFPIIYRLDLTQALQASYGDRIFKRHFRGMERTLEEGLEFCCELARAGVEGFDVDKGCYDNWFYPHPPAYFDDIPYVRDMAGSLKKHFQSKEINAQVIAVGKMGKPEAAAQVLEENWADYVMLGRPLLADPHWPNKVREGRIREITHCIGDQEACIQSFIMGGHPCCAVNPYTGFEDTKKLEPARQRKKVAVIGGGPAGCEAARTAFLRGHEVYLFEKEAALGGQLRLSINMPIKHDIKRYLENLQYQIDLLAEQGLSIEYNHTASAQELAGKYDVIICCSGLRGSIPALEGLESIPHAEVRDFLRSGGELPPNTQKVTVIGGGLVGCEAAYTLASQKGVEVTIVEKQAELMTGVVHANRAMMLWMLAGMGSPSDSGEDVLPRPVQAYTSTEAVKVVGKQIYLKAHRQRTDPYTPWRTLIPENVHNPFAKKLKPGDTEDIVIDSDFVVLATGGQSDNSLYYQLMAQKAAPEIYCVGDSQQPGRVWEAVTSANEVARSI